MVDDLDVVDFALSIWTLNCFASVTISIRISFARRLFIQIEIMWNENPKCGRAKRMQDQDRNFKRKNKLKKIVSNVDVTFIRFSSFVS